MSSLTILGDTSGSVVLQAPAVSGSTTLTLPATTGTVLTTANQNYFYAYRTSSQSATSGAHTQVQLNTALQSGTSFNTSTYTWTATATDAGVWMFFGDVSVFSGSNNISNVFPLIYKNSSLAQGNYGYINPSSAQLRHFTAHTQYATAISAGDTLQLYGQVDGTSPFFYGGDSYGGFNQCSLIGVKLA